MITIILPMKSADLPVNGTYLYSLLLNASLNWPLISSALSECHFSPFLGNGIPCWSFPEYWCICKSLRDLPLLPSCSHTNYAVFNVSLAFIFSSQSFKLCPKVINTCLLCLCMNFIPSVNLSSYLRRAPRHRRNTLDFEGKCLSAESCMDKVVKLKFFLVLIKHLRGRRSLSVIRIHLPLIIFIDGIKIC